MAYESRNTVFSVGTMVSIVAGGGVPGGGGGGYVALATPLIDYVRFYFALGSGISAGDINFYELGGDGTWRISTFLTAPWSGYPAIAASTNYSGTLQGPFLGLQAQLTNFVGGNVTYGELFGTARP